MKLLIVDDSNVMRRAIERAAVQFPFKEIRSAENGRKALLLFDTFEPDFVTLDITMPELDGLSTLDEILSRDPAARVLIVSALADTATAIESLKRGAEQFICKPFTSQELREAFDEMLHSL